MTIQTNSAEVSTLLQRWRDGDREALEQLLPLVYGELRQIAARQLRRHQGHGTLQTTALVHDVFLRMINRAPTDFESTAHLLNAAGRMMRQILVDRMRSPDASRRVSRTHDDFTRSMQLPIPEEIGIIDLDQALSELEQFDQRMAQIVELRCFVGLGTEEISHAIGVSGRTVQRDWLLAQAWLRERLSA